MHVGKLYKNGLLAIVACCLCAIAAAQTPGFIQSDKVKVAGVTTEGGVISLPDSQKISSRSYMDGLGRTIQTVSIQASPLKKDMVQAVFYDNLGQVNKSYLPYTATSNDGSFQTSPLTAQPYFYANSPKVANDDSLYTRQVFENSPLQRLLRAGSVGNGFEPGAGQHYKTLTYRTNTAADNVIIWSTAGVNTGYYAAGNLQVVDATVEDGARILSFTNNSGQTVLKKELKDSGAGTYLSTYYVYNEAGALRNVLPPKAVALMQTSGNWSLTQTAIANLIFGYQYDKRGRAVQKTLPGGIVVYTVYDPLERPVLVQDNKLRAANQWNYIKYDARDNPISQGIYTDATHVGLSAMQSYVSGLNYSTTWFESRNSTSGTGYYTNTVFPTSGIDALAYSYLDNYDLDGNGSADYSYQVQGLSGEASPTSMLRGIPTMLRSRTVGQGLSNIWLIRVMFYDKNGRSIQVQSNNQLTSAVSDIATNVPEFTGVTRIAKVNKVVASASTTVLTTFSYDHMYRAMAVDQSYNAGSVMRVAAYEYNELGQLVKKNLKQVNTGTIPYHVTLGTAQSVASGQTSHVRAQNSITMSPDFVAATGSVFTAKIATNYLQAVDYRYNIRGQLVNINNSRLIDDNGVTNNDANDLFGVDILYNTVDANVGNTAQWSGRISAVKWMSRNADGMKTNERSYKYSYDVLNRLNSGTYAERGSAGGGSFNINSNGFNESGITYDDNGNILSLQRNSSSVGTTSNIQVDDLVYTYDTDNPNRLKKVVDGVGANYVSYGFRNLTGSSSDYSYDSSGNLTADPYKGLTISYNELSRANQITITTATNRYIRYTYDSGGQLIRKQAYDNAVLQKTTDYIDGFVYENSTLAYFAIPEGRVINVSGTLTPEFVITDQQGNARISFRDDGSGKAVVVQENSYYAFGLTFATSPVGTPAAPNKNLYNGGSEWQNDFSNLPDYYNTFFRNYDQALGRFVSLDPMAEAVESLTGYNYSGNNPVMFNDPLGDVYAEQAGSSGIPPHVDANGIPAGDPGYGGGSGGDGSRGDAFIRRTAEKFFRNAALRRDAALGDPNALARYVAKYGEPSILDFTSYVDWYKDENGKPYTVDGISGVGEWYILKPLKAPDEQETGIGQPGAFESVIPLWGSGRSFIDNMQNGRYGRAAFDAAMFASDVFLVKAAVTAVGKAVIVGISKSSARKAAAITFKSFTRGNFRHNLAQLTGHIPANSQAHHVFPKKFEAIFSNMNINVNNPAFGVWWDSAVHSRKSWAYNAEWEAFLRSSPSRAEVFNFGRQIMAKYGLPIGF
jgi:RHS repeat-associated protein